MGRLHPFWAFCVLAACRPATREPPPATDHDAAQARARTPVHRDPLGLTDGTTWSFHGSVTRADDLGNAVTQPLAWTTTVAAVEEKRGAVTYRIVGWPGDAPDMPARAITIVVDNGVVELDGTPWFRLPLTTGAELCDEDGYCWSVDAAETGFDLVFRTGPDYTVYHLEAGKGVTRYEYHHNGTSDEVVLDRLQ
jgi:hypothetical protein